MFNTWIHTTIQLSAWLHSFICGVYKWENAMCLCIWGKINIQLKWEKEFNIWHLGCYFIEATSALPEDQRWLKYNFKQKMDGLLQPTERTSYSHFSFNPLEAVKKQMPTLRSPTPVRWRGGQVRGNKHPRMRINLCWSVKWRKKHGDSEAPPFGTVINTTLEK